MTSPPILAILSTRFGRAFLLEALPLSELLEEPLWAVVLRPLGLLFAADERILVSLAFSNEFEAKEAPVFDAPFDAVPERFSGVRGVRVVCGAGGSEGPLTL
jgi:hypothetical protein